MIEPIPAIDIVGRKCVRLAQGDYSASKIYSDDPLKIAKEFERVGIKRLHVVDLDGAKNKHIVNVDILKTITSETNLKVDFGGGIKTDEDIRIAFDCGAAMVTVGSVAVTDRSLFERWLEEYGPERIILGADVRDGKVSVNGWKDDTDNDLVPFLEYYVSKGVKNVLCTDISKDGMLSGPAFDLYSKVMHVFPEINLIASGGISSVDDIRELDRLGVPSVVFGKAYYEGKITLDDLKPYDALWQKD